MCSDGPTTHWRSWSSRTSRSDHHQVHRLDGNRRHQISSLITIKNKHNELIVVNVQSLLLSHDWAEHYISTKHKFYPTCIYLYRKTNWRWFHWLLVASSLWCNTDISFSINTMLKWIQSFSDVLVFIFQSEEDVDDYQDDLSESFHSSLLRTSCYWTGAEHNFS